jgi:hypothetical protein
MLNKNPIFLNCFSRGGSNILWNIYLSHPQVCSPIQETVQIFRGGWRGTRAGLTAALLSQQWRLFDQKYLQPRKPLSRPAQEFIDRTFYEWKLKTITDEEMRCKTETAVYKLEEVQQARLVAKNNNGLAFLSDIWHTIYPDTVSIALVRNPLALYESYQRRRFMKSIDEFVSFYCHISQKMLNDAARYEHYHIIRFEDIMADPIGMTEKLYKLSGLDLAPIDKMRFKAKSHFNQNGKHTTRYEEGQHYWFTFDQVRQFLEPKINELQIQRLPPRDVATIKKQTQTVASAMGYHLD